MDIPVDNENPIQTNKTLKLWMHYEQAIFHLHSWHIAENSLHRHCCYHNQGVDMWCYVVLQPQANKYCINPYQLYYWPFHSPSFLCHLCSYSNIVKVTVAHCKSDISMVTRWPSTQQSYIWLNYVMEKLNSLDITSTMENSVSHTSQLQLHFEPGKET